jgi:hypothetical protein
MCGENCGRDTYAELRDGEVKYLYCSLKCFTKATELQEQIEEEIARQVQKECNWLHVRVCRRCQGIIQGVHQRMQVD